MFIETNANPYNKHIDDCVIRAITLATGNDYFDVMDDLIYIADEHGWDIDDVSTMWNYLCSIGWKPKYPKKNFTVKKYSQEHLEPSILLVNGHATFTKDGNVYDTWNCNRYRVKWIFQKKQFINVN